MRTQVKFSQLQFIHNLPNEHSQQKSCILSVVRWRERTQRDREASAPEAPISCGPGAEVLPIPHPQQPLTALYRIAYFPVHILVKLVAPTGHPLLICKA